MEKPILLVRDELIKNIYSAIQNSGLLLMIIEPTLKDIHRDILRALQEEYAKQMQEYNAHLEEDHSSDNE